MRKQGEKTGEGKKEVEITFWGGIGSWMGRPAQCSSSSGSSSSSRTSTSDEGEGCVW